MDKPTLTFGSLFSGIGGLDLGLERAGMRCEWQVEIDDYATKVLTKHWPDVARHGDVRDVGKHNLSRVDCIVGGFPCQPHSAAGQRKASEDERDLWPEFARIIRELEPRWIVAENVLGLLSSEDGTFFGGILRDLAEAGYDARWHVLSAAQFGAPHLRERVILVAYRNIGQCEERTQLQAGWKQISGGRDVRTNTGRCGASVAHTHSDRCGQRTYQHQCQPRSVGLADAGLHGAQRNVANASSSGRQECSATAITGEPGHAPWRKIAPGRLVESSTSRREWFDPCAGGSTGTQSLSEQPGAWATQPGMGRTAYGLPSWLDGYRWPARPGQSQEAWEAPRVVTDRKINRTQRLKGLGNAVVPALAELVGRCIMAVEAERAGVA